MHIGFVLIPYQLHTGAGEYYHNLIKALMEHAPSNRYSVFLPKGAPHSAYEFFGKENCIETSVPSQPAGIRYVCHGVFRPAATHKIDVLHSFNFPVPKFENAAVLTIYDLRTEDLGSTAGIGRRIIARFMKKRWLTRVNRIITISDFTKERLCYHYPYCKDKVSTIYFGGPHIRSVPPSPQKLHPRPYILAVGQQASHKNYPRLIRGFTKAVRDHSLPHDLIIIGRNSNGSTEIDACRESCVEKGRVLLMGDISSEKRDAYYQEAELLVFPSLYEGFGLPLVEAWRWKVPVLASDIPVFRELYGIEQALFDPYSSDSIAMRIGTVLSSAEFRDTLIAFGKERLTKFTWAKAADETIRTYNMALGVCQ